MLASKPVIPTSNNFGGECCAKKMFKNLSNDNIFINKYLKTNNASCSGLLTSGFSNTEVHKIKNHITCTVFP